jgi:hypothetical protein
MVRLSPLGVRRWQTTVRSADGDNWGTEPRIDRGQQGATTRLAQAAQDDHETIIDYIYDFGDYWSIASP